MKTKLSRKKRLQYWGLSTLIVIIVVVASGFFFQYRHNKKVFADDIAAARRLVLYNPLVKTGPAEELREKLPGTGDKTTDDQLQKRLNRKDFEALLGKARTQLAKLNQEELTKQHKLALKAKKKLAGLTAKSSFPADAKKDVQTLTDMSDTYFQQRDAVGLNISVAGLQSLAGETASLIQKKTAKSNKLADAIQNGTFPSLGAYRADLPYHAGVILLDMEPGGPADNAGLMTIQNGGWDDSNVITGINQYPIESAVIGNNSMKNVMQQLPLNSTATIRMKDGSKHQVKLDMTNNEAQNSTHKDEIMPATDYGDGDATLGVSGYQYSTKTNDKEIGFMITDIEADSPAADSDLEPGDVICLIDDYAVGTEKSLDMDLSQYYDGDTVTISYVTRDGHLRTTEVTLTEDY